MATRVRQSWKDAAITKSVIITDAWEVFKIYAGRGAEWILFITMVLNIVEMFPGVTFWPAVANAIMLVQVITLDIAGFGLASMADHAYACGHEAAARQARRVARSLIGIMIVTLLLVTAGVLFGTQNHLEWLKPWLGYGEDILIFARIIMVVLYGHTIHQLREATATYTPPSVGGEEIARLQADLDQATQSAADALRFHQEELARIEQSYQDFQARSLSDAQEWRDKIAALEGQIQELQQAKIEASMQPDDNQDVNEDVNQLETESAQIVDMLVYKNRAKSVNEDVNQNETKVSTNVSTTIARGGAREKALRLLKKQPTITPAQLAEKAGITRQYASKLLAEQRAKNEALNA